MTKTFLHSVDPPTASPVAAPSVDLEVSEIEEAGIREVLQMSRCPLASVGRRAAANLAELGRPAWDANAAAVDATLAPAGQARSAGS